MIYRKNEWRMWGGKGGRGLKHIRSSSVKFQLQFVLSAVRVRSSSGFAQPPYLDRRGVGHQLKTQFPPHLAPLAARALIRAL